MNGYEQTFLSVVPAALRDIARELENITKELKELKEQIKKTEE